MKNNAFISSVLSQKKFLRAFALKLTNNKELANDLFQDTVYRALKNEDKYKGGNIKAWLATIMRNLFINGIRQSKRTMHFIDQKSKDYLLTNHGEVAVNHGEGNVLMKELQKEVDLLHPDLKIPFIMVYKGYQYNEIAAHLEKPIGTVKSRVHIARKSLIKKLNQLYGDRGLPYMVA